MKALFSTFVLGALLLTTGCAHNSKCQGGKCEVKSEKECSCCAGKEGKQCDMKKHKKDEVKKS